VSFELRQVGLVYPSRSGAVAALGSVTLSVAQGERVALLGPSGAGKSSILRLLNATLRPTSGNISFAGQDLLAASGRELRALRSRVGTVFQQPSLVPALPVLQNVLCGKLGSWSLWRSLRALVAPDAADREAALAALETVGLRGKAGARADELSGGQQQRVAIARVLLQDPEVILADEPFASLDPGLTAQLAELLFGLARGRTLIAALHDVELAIAHFPRLVGVRSGRVLFDRPAGEVTRAMLEELYAQERA
jgi:phosphonate transport system ATP-binding protein